VYRAITDSFINNSTGERVIDKLGFDYGTLDVSALGFTGLGDGSGNTLRIAYSAATDRTYVQNKTADAQGHAFEIGLTGNLLNHLSAANVDFASTAEVELLGVTPVHEA
jgi:serralysin